MIVLALYSNKGGVGKTTAAVDLSYLAARDGVSTLLVDLDAQGSATYYFRVQPKLKRKARGLSTANKAVSASVQSTNYRGLDVLPADLSNRNLDLVYDQQKRRRHRLQDTLSAFKQDYDLIVLDCPPSINVLGENIFVAANHVVVPLIPTTLSLRAHDLLRAFLQENDYSEERWHLFFSMVDRRKKMHVDLMDAARLQYSNVLESVIPQQAQVEQMGLRRDPLPAYAPRSTAALAYRSLWAEIRGFAKPGSGPRHG